MYDANHIANRIADYLTHQQMLRVRRMPAVRHSRHTFCYCPLNACYRE